MNKKIHDANSKKLSTSNWPLAQEPVVLICALNIYPKHMYDIYIYIRISYIHIDGVLVHALYPSNSLRVRSESVRKAMLAEVDSQTAVLGKMRSSLQKALDMAAEDTGLTSATLRGAIFQFHPFNFIGEKWLCPG